MQQYYQSLPDLNTLRFGHVDLGTLCAIRNPETGLWVRGRVTNVGNLEGIEMVAIFMVDIGSSLRIPLSDVCELLRKLDVGQDFMPGDLRPMAYEVCF